MTNRRFCTPKVTRYGRIGHPGAIDRKLVPCVGVVFEDRREGCKWTFRMYEAYGPDWPAMDVWTVQRLMPVNRQGGSRSEAYGNQQSITVEAVPEDVQAFAMAELVRLRLKGKVDG